MARRTSLVTPLAGLGDGRAADATDHHGGQATGTIDLSFRSRSTKR